MCLLKKNYNITGELGLTLVSASFIIRSATWIFKYIVSLSLCFHKRKSPFAHRNQIIFYIFHIFYLLSFYLFYYFGFRVDVHAAVFTFLVQAMESLHDTFFFVEDTAAKRCLKVMFKL